MSPQTILVGGGGIAGMCAAIELRKRGHHVDRPGKAGSAATAWFERIPPTRVPLRAMDH